MRRKEPCQNCRKHHVKCDDQYPTCSRCQKSGKECIRSTPRWHFRHSSAQQNTPSRPNTNTAPGPGTGSFEYVDETPNLVARFAPEAGQSGSQVEESPVEHSPQSVQTPQGVFDSVSPGLSIHSQIVPSIWAPGNVDKSVYNGVSPGISPLPLSRQAPLPPLDLEEACLLRYFVEHLARWFDHCDPNHHFAIAVPQRARKCPPLLDALLCASARHFSTLSPNQQTETTRKYGLPNGILIDEETALRYHSRAIAHLRSVSEHPDAIMDENLLAAVVTLRFYEELDSPFIDHPSETAVRGLQVFILAQAESALSTPGFRQAVFWIGFRQEFHMAFSRKRPFCIPLSVCERYLPYPHAPDHIWVNHLLIIAAHVIQYCFDDEYRQTYTRHEELTKRLAQWLETCPSSFSPIHFEPPDPSNGEIFPKVWYIDDSHIIAIQTIGLAHILLAAYNPHTARIGPARHQAMRDVDETVRSTVLEICGIAMSNRQSPTSLLTACWAVLMCCDRFTERREQDALMGIVRYMNTDNNYWPTTAMEARLRGAWGWVDSPVG